MGGKLRCCQRSLVLLEMFLLCLSSRLLRLLWVRGEPLPASVGTAVLLRARHRPHCLLRVPDALVG